MSIARWEPTRSYFGWPGWLEDFEDAHYQRGLKIHETDKNIVVEAVVAGVPANCVGVEIEDGVLIIKAEAEEEVKKKGEFRASACQYYYTATLSGGDWDKATAEVINGVVTVTVPKTEAARPRKITVKSREE